MKTIHTIILFSFLFLVGCDKDENSNNGGNGNPSGETGDFSAVANETVFESNTAWARYESTGELIILAANQDKTRGFLLTISNFIGNGTYDLTVGSANTALYQYTINGQFVEFHTSSDGTGSIQITNYNDANQSFDGSFEFTARQSGSPSNLLTVEDGVFENVKILQAPQPEPGFAAGYALNRPFNTDDVKVRILNNFFLEIEIIDASLTNSIKLHTGYANNELSTYFDCGIPSAYSTYQHWIRAYSADIISSELSDGNQSISLEIFSSDIDLELSLNDIQITPTDLMEVEVGTVQYKKENGDVILFDNAQITIGHPNSDDITYTFEAYNDDNNKLYFFYEIETNGPFGPPPYIDYEDLGTNVVLEFFEDADDWYPTSSTYGQLGYDYVPGSSQTRTFGFVSSSIINDFDGEGVEMRCREITKIE